MGRGGEKDRRRTGTYDLQQLRQESQDDVRRDFLPALKHSYRGNQRQTGTRLWSWFEWSAGAEAKRAPNNPAPALETARALGLRCVSLDPRGDSWFHCEQIRADLRASEPL